METLTPETLTPFFIGLTIGILFALGVSWLITETIFAILEFLRKKYDLQPKEQVYIIHDRIDHSHYRYHDD